MADGDFTRSEGRSARVGRRRSGDALRNPFCFLPQSILPALILVTACLPRFQQPEVRLEAVRLGGLGLLGGTLHAQVVVSNPNGYDLRAAAMSYELELGDPAARATDGWIPLANGALDRDVTVAAGDSTLIDVPVEFTYAGVGSAIRSLLERGVLDYRLTGDLNVTEPLRRRVPFRRTGTVDLTRTR